MTPTVPVTVTYELTDLGYSLHDVMRRIKVWAEAHMDEVLANREAYDTRVTQRRDGPRRVTGAPAISSLSVSETNEELP